MTKTEQPAEISPSLAKRREFMRLPVAERRRMLEKQVAQVSEEYRRELANVQSDSPIDY